MSRTTTYKKKITYSLYSFRKKDRAAAQTTKIFRTPGLHENGRRERDSQASSFAGRTIVVYVVEQGNKN